MTKTLITGFKLGTSGYGMGCCSNAEAAEVLSKHENIVTTHIFGNGDTVVQGSYNEKMQTNNSP